jgi:hypothetical protein
MDFSKPLSISEIGDGTPVEDGDGYVNFVYRVSDGNLKLILKQARKEGRGGNFDNLPMGRAALEYDYMKIMQVIIPEYLPKLYFYDEEYLIFAVEVTGSHSGTILLLKDLGDVEYTYMDAPFVIFEGTQTPAVDFVDGSAVAIEENIFKLTIPAGQKITYVDMLNDLPVKGEDGFYHLGTEDGPILYVDLGENAPYLSLSVMIGAVGQFGTSFKNIFFNEDGTPEVNADGTYHKEDYTDALLAYCLHRDPETGLYPLTDDLVYMLQHGGKFKGWYTPGSGTYLLEEKEITVDPALLWMFAVCYLK